MLPGRVMSPLSCEFRRILPLVVNDNGHVGNRRSRHVVAIWVVARQKQLTLRAGPAQWLRIGLIAFGGPCEPRT